MRLRMLSWHLVLAVVAVLPGTTARAQGIDYDKIEILTQQLAPNFYTLTGSAGADPGHREGAGGRIGVLVGSDGIFMVDATYAPLTDKVVAAIRRISPAPIRFLVNTHEHPDHTGGNPNFVKLGALLFAREEVRQELIPPPPPAVAAIIGKAASWTDPARLPVVTYGLGEPLKIRMNGEVIDLIPLPPAHTDGDTIVRFENADVIMIGDFYRNYGYPFIDPTHGGSFKGVLEALDKLMKIAGPNTKLVPGHGTVINKSDLIPYRDMILNVRTEVQRMIGEGKTLQEVLAAKITTTYDAKVSGSDTKVPGIATSLPAGSRTSADRFIGALYAELKSGK